MRVFFLLGDQLSPSLLAGCVRARDLVVLAEVADETRYVPHHPQKIALIFSAMRHFAADLRTQGFRVHYHALTDTPSISSFIAMLDWLVATHAPTQIIMTEPGEWRVEQALIQWQGKNPNLLHMQADPRFFASRADFAAWAKGKKQWRQEFFYRLLRQRHQILLEADGTPAGGAWNYDSENRAPPKAGLTFPAAPQFPPDAITQEVLALVAARFGQNFGTLTHFHWPVTTAEAQIALDHFITHALPHFGTYQDAMWHGEHRLYHSLLSPLLNIGLLSPQQVVQAALQAYASGHAPLPAVEGFVRQILGWREYVRGLYWHTMPSYATRNALQATRPLPALYWGGATRMACMAEVVRQTRDYAYSHHIQRLMVTGNFALLAGINPSAVNEWYLAVYADAFEWVELPNTHGMALYADGGIMASKPYAASGKYIHRMSNFCASCAFDPNETVGPRACPFNSLYWRFLATHEPTLKNNPRLGMIYANFHKQAAKMPAILAQAEAYLAQLARDEL